jgi:hypothetical protein
MWWERPWSPRRAAPPARRDPARETLSRCEVGAPVGDGEARRNVAVHSLIRNVTGGCQARVAPPTDATARHQDVTAALAGRWRLVPLARPDGEPPARPTATLGRFDPEVHVSTQIPR